MDDKSFNIRLPKRWVRLGMIVTVTALIVAPLTAWAGHVFTDVPNSNTFHNDITWMADAGVTKGCNPPANDRFCPDDNVSRGQMSAFMRRFAKYIDAEDGTPAQADNADTLDGVDSSELLKNDTIILSQTHNAWVANVNVPPTSGGPLTNASYFSGDGYIQMSLTTPASIGGTAYGLQKLEICYQVSGAPGYINFIQLWRGTTAGVGSLDFQDPTDRASTTWDCFTVQPNLVAKRGINLVANLSGGGQLYLGSVRSTWSSDLTGMTADRGLDSLGDSAASLGG